VGWKIQKTEGSNVTDLETLPGHMSVAEVETTLQRLVCSHLSEKEVVAASLRKEMGGHSDLLERAGVFEPICFGHGDLKFVATRENPSV
jgi:hypothetical protein